MSTILKTLPIYLCLMLFQSSPLYSQVVINEVMASNGITIFDEDAENADWIEIFNLGDSAIHIGGYGLTDDPTKSFKWIFPKMKILPQQHSLIFASDKDRRIYIEH